MNQMMLTPCEKVAVKSCHGGRVLMDRGSCSQHLHCLLAAIDGIGVIT